jgi:hypothetical protein
MSSASVPVLFKVGSSPPTGGHVLQDETVRALKARLGVGLDQAHELPGRGCCSEQVDFSRLLLRLFRPLPSFSMGNVWMTRYGWTRWG